MIVLLELLAFYHCWAQLIAFRFHCFTACLTRVLHYWTFLYTSALQVPVYYYYYYYYY